MLRDLQKKLYLLRGLLYKKLSLPGMLLYKKHAQQSINTMLLRGIDSISKSFLIRVISSGMRKIKCHRKTPLINYIFYSEQLPYNELSITGERQTYKNHSGFYFYNLEQKLELSGKLHRRTHTPSMLLSMDKKLTAEQIQLLQNWSKQQQKGFFRPTAIINIYLNSKQIDNICGGENSSHANNLHDLFNIICKQHRGKIVINIIIDQLYLLPNHIFDIEKNNRDKFNEVCQKHNITLKKLQDRLANFSNTKLLVIGDTIVDHYVACDALGMSAEAPVLVVKELENREFIGGAAIVALHTRALGSNCHYISVVGEDSQASLVSETLSNQGIKADLFSDPSRPTTYKTRYIVENQKLFRVSRIKDHKISKEIEDKIVEKITLLAPKLDGIMISDFVYGVITNKILESITKLSEQFGIKLYGDLQCSSQVGKVSKFSGFDLITPTEKESRIALEDNESGIEWIANTLMNNTNS
ncbi:MAG: PfkB family carbohydrate kinase, partial [Candidatus Thioglobus sp.]